MFRTVRFAVTLAAALGSALALAGSAQAQQPGIVVGTLTCNVASGFGFVFGSSRALNCTFAGPGRYEYYSGSISRFGVDIGYIQGGILVWTVVAPTPVLAPGTLAGNYVGGTASATVGVGLGAANIISGERTGRQDR